MTESNINDEDKIVRFLGYEERRVLGVLIEKGITTPEYYPMTLKAVTTACNQKNNRSPVVEFTEDDVEDALTELQKLGLVGRILPETGRVEKFRHYARQRYTFTEPQLAIVTELLLRGQQSLGDLRVRASRMVPIDDLDKLRTEVRGLIEAGFVQANGTLEQRGVEVDHCMYRPEEHRRMSPLSAVPEPAPSSASRAPAVPSGVSAADFEKLASEHRALAEEVATLKGQVGTLSQQLAKLLAELS